jgi:hypothetical protein
MKRVDCAHSTMVAAFFSPYRTWIFNGFDDSVFLMLVVK